MSNKYIYSIVVICFAFNFSFGQNVPGYMGKKAFVDYNFTAPIFLALGTNYSNFVHNVRFNYVIRRRAQVGASFELYRFEDEIENGGRSLPSIINGKSVGVNFDWYTKYSIAPVGNYFRLEYKYLFGDYEDQRYEYDPSTFTEKEFTDVGNVGNHYYGFGYGIRRIFFDKMVFNVGGSFGFVSGTFDAETSYAELLGATYLWQIHVGVGYLLF